MEYPTPRQRYLRQCTNGLSCNSIHYAPDGVIVQTHTSTGELYCTFCTYTITDGLSLTTDSYASSNKHSCITGPCSKGLSCTSSDASFCVIASSLFNEFRTSCNYYSSVSDQCLFYLLMKHPFWPHCQDVYSLGCGSNEREVRSQYWRNDRVLGSWFGVASGRCMLT
ncbi:hypothetical protein OUZ56_017079 [Daphnia magna]|uniref:Uncharacterized protein n=1 Tax=Daphnia magna TaxID=35525 RepID=A0ABR0AS56_9CRUS|nr:hypothetical protein OUZ56_017079 [Daphnia magna]